jgi:hypothetical protein
MQLDDVARLGFQPDDVDTPSEGLQIRIGASRFAKRVHHLEGVFVAVEVQRLEPRATAGFEVVNARISGRFERWEKVFCQNARAVDGLEAVTERRTHEVNLLGHALIS